MSELTHHPLCWQQAGHHECAKQRIKELTMLLLESEQVIRHNFIEDDRSKRTRRVHQRLTVTIKELTGADSPRLST